MTADLPPIQRLAAGGDFTLEVNVHNGRLWRHGRAGVHRREYAVPTARGKRGQGHRMVPLPPLDSPKPSFALTHRRCAAKRGLRGLGSGRRAAFGTLSGPEVSLRYPPRITVRGQTVQGGGVLLRKALLRSRVVPWSTKRPCGPLAFRRATAGSRVQRKVRGVKRGQETMFGVLSPFALRRGHGVSAAEGGQMCTLTLSVNLASSGAPLDRRNRLPSADGKEKKDLC